MWVSVVQQPISCLEKKPNFFVISHQFKEISSSCVLNSVVVQAEAEISVCNFSFLPMRLDLSVVRIHQFKLQYVCYLLTMENESHGTGTASAVEIKADKQLY